MKYEELKKALAIAKGKVTISANRLTDNVKTLITDCYYNQPIVITRAEPGPGDGENQTVVISGQATFLNVTDAPVTAQFSLDNKGNVKAIFKYKLRSETVTPISWKFSTSFPKLPAVLNYETAINATQTSFLDGLDLYNSYYVVTTHSGTESEFNIPLERGINFVSQMRPQGMLGVLENSLGKTKSLTLYGTIIIPKETDRTLALKPLERVWDRTNLPGIKLQAAMDVDFKLGKMVFNQAFFRVYSPPSTEWLLKNNTFQPVHGYTGTLQIPSADIEINLNANLKWGMPEAILYGECEGITLAKLTQLMDVGGDGDFDSKLPVQIQKAVKKLNQLELMYIALDISAVNHVPTISGASFTIGMPNLNWEIWDDSLTVESIACRFEIENPLGRLSSGISSPSSRLRSTKPSVSVRVMGTVEIEGAPISIHADSRNNFTLYAYLGEKQTIPLKKLMKKYVPGVPAPSDLNIDSMAVTVAPGQFYAMSMAMAGKPNAWIVDVGPSKLTISDVSLDFSYPTGGPLSGGFAGRIDFTKDLSLAMDYNIPGEFVIKGMFPKIKLSQLVAKLCNQKAALPKGFDMTFEYSSAMIRKQGTSLAFQFASMVKNTGNFAFEARKVGSKWGFAAGLDMSAGNPSQLPGLSAISIFEKAFTLEKFLLVVSSFDNAGFQFPDLAQFNNPRITAGSIALPGRGGVVAGLNAFGEWRINTKDKKQKLLQKLLGLEPTVGVTLQVGKIPATEAKLFVRYDATLNGHPFLCQFGAMIQGKDVALFLNGSITVKIQKQPQTFDLTMAFVKTGAFLSANVSGPTAIKFGPFQLSNLALEIGVSWQGIPSFGIAATLNVSKFQSSMAVLFDSKNPARSLVAGSVSDLTLKDVVDTLVGKKKASSIDKPLADVSIRGTQTFDIDTGLADDLDQLEFGRLTAAFRSEGGITIPSNSTQLHLVVAKKGQLWYLTDKTSMRYYQLRKRGSRIEASIQAQFYCAPMDTYIGTKRFAQGYFINGAIQFLDFDALVRVDISMNKGIAIDSQMDKIVVGNENIYSITAVKGKGGPRISVATFSQPKHKVKAFRRPHFYINGRSQMLGLVQEAYVSLTVKGLEFELKGPLAPAVNFDVKGVINGSKGLEAAGKVKVGLGTIDLGKLGNVPIKTDAEGIIAVKVGVRSIGATAKATFQALGKTHSIATFKLNTKTKALLNLAETMVKEAAKELKAVFKDAAKWANAVGDGMVEGVDDAGKVLKDVYKQSAGQAAKLMKKAGFSVNDLTRMMRDVYKTSPRDIAKTLKGMRVGGKDIAKALKSSGVNANAIGEALRHDLGFSSDDGTKLMKEIGFSSKDIAGMLRGPWHKGSKNTAKILRKSGKYGKGTIKSAMKHAGWSNKDVNKAIDWIKKLF